MASIFLPSIRYDATSDDLIDVVEGNRSYMPCIYLLNKIDQISIEELDVICEIPHCVPISAHHKWNYDSLLEKLWEYLRLVNANILFIERAVGFSFHYVSHLFVYRFESTPSRKANFPTTNPPSFCKLTAAPSRTSATSSIAPLSKSSSTLSSGDPLSSINLKGLEKTISFTTRMLCKSSRKCK